MIAAEAGPFSQQLRCKIALVIPPRVEQRNSIWRHPRLRDLLPELMFTVHTIIRASVQLMRAALWCARKAPSSDALFGEIARYFEPHIAEEMHHDEWLLQDMEVLGIKRSEVLRRLPSTRVASMVGAQYYWIYHVHPIALLGYIAVMEGCPPAAEEVEAAISRSALPRDVFRTFLIHADLDGHHREELDQFLDRLSLSPEHADLIGVSSLTTAIDLSRIYEEAFASFIPRDAQFVDSDAGNM